MLQLGKRLHSFEEKSAELPWEHITEARVFLAVAVERELIQERKKLLCVWFTLALYRGLQDDGEIAIQQVYCEMWSRKDMQKQNDGGKNDSVVMCSTLDTTDCYNIGYNRKLASMNMHSSVGSEQCPDKGQEHGMSVFCFGEVIGCWHRVPTWKPKTN